MFLGVVNTGRGGEAQIQKVPMGSDLAVLLVDANLNTLSTSTTLLPNPAVPVSMVFSKNWWVAAYGGYDYAFFGDLNTASRNYANFLREAGSPSTIQGPAQTGNSGIRAGMEIGFSLDQENAISLSLENVWSQTLGLSYVSNGVVGRSFDVNPDLISASLNYHRNLLSQSWGKTSVSIGLGYYHAVVGMTNYEGNLSTTFTGAFLGDVLGGTLGIGQSMVLDDSFEFKFSLKGRWATFNQLQASSISPNMNAFGPPYELVVIKNENFGLSSDADYIDYAPQQLINMHPNDYRYAVVDYSGFSADISFYFHF